MQVKNAQPMVAKFGGTLGTVLAGADMWSRSLLGVGIAPAMQHHTDAQATARADHFKPIAYPRADGVISFDRLTMSPSRPRCVTRTSHAI